MKEVSDVLSRTSKASRANKASVPTVALVQTAVEALVNKKGQDILVMDMRGVSGVADVFVLATGDSDLQIKALADAVRAEIKEQHGESAWHKEGYEHRQWILLDYVDLVVHVFDQERREFYGLDRLWGDAPREAVEDDGGTPTIKMLESFVPPAKKP